MKNKRSVTAGILSAIMLASLIAEPAAFLRAEETTVKHLAGPIEENMSVDLSGLEEDEITESHGDAQQAGSLEVPAEDDISGQEQEYVVMAANEIGFETV